MGDVRKSPVPRRRFATMLAGVSAMAVFLSTPALARAEWLPPVDVSPPGEHAGMPDVALDAAGNATAVWERWNGENTVVEVAYRPAGAPWQPAVELSEEGLVTKVSGEHDASFPRVAVDAAGDATVVWERYAGGEGNLIQTAYRPAGGSWQAPVDLGETPGGADPEPRVAADEAGDVLAVWKSGEVIEASYRPAGGAWGTAAALSGGESYVPQAAMDARGDIVVAWMHFDGSRYVVEGVFKPEGEGWQAPALISQEGEEAGDPHVALNRFGDAMVAWDGHPESGEVAQVAYRPAGGKWQAPIGVSKPGDQAQGVSVALDEHGDALLVWSDGTKEAGGHDIVQSSYKPAGGDWQAPISLSDGSENAYPNDLTFDDSGNAVLLWQRSNGSHDVAQADYRPAGGEWQAPVSFSEEGNDSFDAVVVLDAPGSATTADGDAAVVWTTTEGGCPEPPPWKCGTPEVYRVQAAGYDAIEPPESLQAPTVVEAGSPVTISGPSLDVWSPELSFGDGAMDTATSGTHTYATPGEYTIALTSTEVLGYTRSLQQKIRVEPARRTGAPPAQGGSAGSGSGSQVGTPNQEAHESGTPTSGTAQAGLATMPVHKPGVAALEQTLRSIRRSHELRFRCRLTEPGLCVVRTAMGSAHVSLSRAGEAILTIHLKTRSIVAIERLRLLRLHFIATTVGHVRTASKGWLTAR